MHHILLYVILFVLVIGHTEDLAAVTREPVRIHVSIPPQKFLVERIGGNKVDVTVLLKQGMSPETYEPTPKQMVKLNASSLYFRIGVPFEDLWIDQIAALNPELRIIPCCASLVLKDHKKHRDIMDKFIYDTHLWTSPRNAGIIGGIIKETLVNYDTANAGYYEENYKQLLEDLKDADSIIRKNLEGIRHKILIVSHPSWSHFADAYGLQQIPIERHGSELRARELARLVKLVNEYQIKTIYVQPQYITTAAKALAHETGARIIEIDPLAEDFINNLVKVSLLIREGNS